jgi:hypothetical protein
LEVLDRNVKLVVKAKTAMMTGMITLILTGLLRVL